MTKAFFGHRMFHIEWLSLRVEIRVCLCIFGLYIVINVTFSRLIDLLSLTDTWMMLHEPQGKKKKKDFP